MQTISGMCCMTTPRHDMLVCCYGYAGRAHLLANLRVDRLSANASMAGLIMHIMVVLQLPPRLSSRMRVSLLSRYGMWARSCQHIGSAGHRISACSAP